MKKTIIYTRVSTDEQVDNMSLENQLNACQRYAAANDMQIVQEFREEGESAKTAKRTKLLELLAYCQKNKGNVDVLLVWKVDRFSRRTEDHMAIKATLKKLGVTLASATEPIEDNMMGRLMETVLSGFAQFDNEVRAERCLGGMEKRLEEGSWPFHAPIGYRNVKDVMGRPTLEPSEQAPLITRWLREFAKGTYSQRDMHALAWDMGIRTKGGKRLVYQYACDMLRNPLYAGIVASKLIEGERQGIHPPLITREEFEANQDILNGKKRRGVLSTEKGGEWPLRGDGMVACALCTSPITGSCPRGNGGTYPKYSCPKCRRSVTGKQVSENKETMHEQFLKLLKDIKFTEADLKLFKDEVLKQWDEESKSARVTRRQLDKKMSELEDEKDELVRNLSRAGRLEQERRVVEKIERELVVLQLQRGGALEQELDREAVVAYGINFIGNLPKLWTDASPQYKQRFQKMVFPDGITYDFGIGFGTARLGLCFEVIQQIADNESILVDLSLTQWNLVKQELIAWFKTLHHLPSATVDM